MDPNTSIGRLCLGENNQGSVAEGIENKEHWEGPEFQDTTSSGLEREAKVFTFYRMEEEGQREFYFVKFIVNPEEEDVEPSVILGRSFMRLAKGITDFGNRVITIHPELDPFLDNSEETEKFEDDWDHLLDIDFVDIPDFEKAGRPPFVCKMGKSKRNKKRELENFQLCYSDVGPSFSNGKPLTHEEAAREALAIDICKRFSILKE
ncbi:hypothetical protein Tco_0654390 [Tanacetum coccineum]|uniref:Uncharacterized protein n=1 Tax=Tanacetum coccineum TaxID=301880 RepID=A0ABQ4X328_9ASTR